MNWDTKYRGHSPRERFDNMIGKADTPIGFVFRLCVVGFCVFTAMDPTTTYYTSPAVWAVVWWFIYFYL
jgi:hypothetical protein